MVEAGGNNGSGGVSAYFNNVQVLSNSSGTEFEYHTTEAGIFKFVVSCSCSIGQGNGAAANASVVDMFYTNTGVKIPFE